MHIRLWVGGAGALSVCRVRGDGRAAPRSLVRLDEPAARAGLRCIETINGGGETHLRYPVLR
jgi:hypothetical protein